MAFGRALTGAASRWLMVMLGASLTVTAAACRSTSTAPAPEPTPTAEPTATAGPTFTTEATAPIGGDWPAAQNTGVPPGTVLTTYTGPRTITTANTVIRNSVVNGTLEIQASGVRIINSRLNGGVDLLFPETNSYSYSVTDSEVHVGDNLNTGLMRGNFTADRVEITGGRRSIYCEYNCTITNSWVHDQGGDPGGDAHFSGIRMGESTTLIHNTITCEADRGPDTGCSAGLTGYGDFGPVQNNRIENNIFLVGAVAARPCAPTVAPPVTTSASRTATWPGTCGSSTTCSYAATPANAATSVRWGPSIPPAPATSGRATPGMTAPPSVTRTDSDRT